jgi:hypothetical protein
MAMKRLSITEFAKTHNVSRQACRKWKLKGYLVTEGDSVDVEASDARLRDAGLGRYAKGKNGADGGPARPAGTAKPPVSSIVDALIEQGTDDASLEGFIASMTDGRLRTQAQAAAVKENALALKHTLEALALARELVERSTAERVLFEAARAARDAWLNFPAKAGPLLAADLKVEPGAAVEALTNHVHRQIEELGDPDADFSSGDDQ